MRGRRALAIAVFLVGCAQPTPRERPATQLGRLDSARIDGLCESPDGVHAGREPCVLRDQSQPVRPLPPRR